MPKRGCKSGLKSYRVKSKKGRVRSRCLPEMCKRAKDARFWYNRDAADGKCGILTENLPISKLKEYEDYRKKRRQSKKK